MRTFVYLPIILSVVINFSFAQDSKINIKNPFFQKYETPFEVPPFDKIKEEHYLPAFKGGIEAQQKEVQDIVNNPQPPTFSNTIQALEYSGNLLTKVGSVFYNLNSANTNDELQKIAKEVSPLLSKHRDDINLNEKLFQRIKTIYEGRGKLNLTAEQMRLLEEHYKDFVRGGANLNEEQKTKLREINKELSLLTLKFGENILKETNSFKMILDKKEDLDGLPESVIESSSKAAQDAGLKDKWLFTLDKPSFIPFLQYSKRRDLREKIFNAYINRGNNNNEFDNKEILSKIVSYRIEKAKLLGYNNHAEFILEENMAKTPDKVYDFIRQLWEPALKVAQSEAAKLQEMIKKEVHDFKLEPWDWWYYSEIIKKEKYELDEEILRPYFKLENVRNGAFDVANKLFGITIHERKDIPVYHPDVQVFEVKESDGKHIGLLFMDFHPRPGKRVGAWMNSFRKQYKEKGKNINPLIANVCNFSKPTTDKPSLLSFEEVETLFHEFGHALHGLLSNSTYPSLTGTSVPRDFVELCSQIMENWANEPQVLKSYARHYVTNEPLPDELIERMKKAEHFNQGFATVEYLSAAFLDMDWHTLTEPISSDPMEFEQKSLSSIQLIPEIVVRYRSPYFNHIFSGGYSAGYYSYIWAEVLDADAFEAFKETSLFDKKTAQSFRENILARGGTEDPMVLYLKFRGREPRVEPLLKRKGLN
ncbi:MAG: M3 family metallopeptidase [Bacteroidetes bacterium]|nr:M3 family metallopeptidase [Bacteroidota bacterium]MBU2585862.1 M3 family metallopeptidase [Bacteroidota bacterium]